MLERAAQSGDPVAAFALAETYDARMLASWNVIGVKADAIKARTLYSQALEGGLPEARNRLAALGQ
jgi:TPR repeat protein